MVRQAEEKERCPAVQGRSPGDIYTPLPSAWKFSRSFYSRVAPSALSPGRRKQSDRGRHKTRALPFWDEDSVDSFDGSTEAAQANGRIGLGLRMSRASLSTFPETNFDAHPSYMRQRRRRTPQDSSAAERNRAALVEQARHGGTTGGMRG